MRKIQALTCLVLLIFMCVGCGPKTVRLTRSFDQAQAEGLMRPGKNTIIVKAFLNKPGGRGIVDCYGNPVRLIPATEMAKERMKGYFGTDQGGFVPLSSFAATEFTNADPAYCQYQKEVNCGSNSVAVFKNVADGEFYVLSAVLWRLDYDSDDDEGYLLSKISVSGGETITVTQSHDITPPSSVGPLFGLFRIGFVNGLHPVVRVVGPR